ncbi:hypothetical protein PHMEG_00031266, partial [Phytophthora megakarya]
MGLSAIGVLTADPESTRILVAEGMEACYMHEVRQERTSLGSLPLRVSWMWRTAWHGKTEDVKLGRSSGWYPIRAVHSRYCIYAFVNKTSVNHVSKRPDLHGNSCMGNTPSQFQVFAKSTMWISNQESYEAIRDSRIQIYGLNLQIIRLLRRSRGLAGSRSTDGQQPWIYSRGYWKHHSPGKWFCQAKITGKIHNDKANLLLDTGAEVSIVDTAFARKVKCYIDSSQSQIQDCVGIGDNVYQTEGRTRIKVTLAGSLVYFFDIWVGDLTGQQAILDMDFMVPAGIRLDLAHGSISLPDEVRIQLSGSDKAKIVNVGQYLRIQAGESVELPLRLRSSIHDKQWVTRGDQWVPTVSGGPGRTKYISITSIGDE